MNGKHIKIMKVIFMWYSASIYYQTSENDSA